MFTSTYSCQLTSTQLAVGSYSNVTASFLPSNPSSSNLAYNYATSTSTPAQGFSVIQAATTTTTTTDVTLYVSGQTITATANVTPVAGSGTPTGTVTVSDGTNADVCTITLGSNANSCTFTELVG